ncbi:hypothetical protein ACFWOL_28520 [Streptomyces sp. NPDC058442]|uniref:hypothetical protein n=1 Tax=Streptomyces sp. NPDC058442 TaxID=3346503 RepID=UPI00365E5F96
MVFFVPAPAPPAEEDEDLEAFEGFAVDGGFGGGVLAAAFQAVPHAMQDGSVRALFVSHSEHRQKAGGPEVPSRFAAGFRADPAAGFGARFVPDLGLAAAAGPERVAEEDSPSDVRVVGGVLARGLLRVLRRVPPQPSQDVSPGSLNVSQSAHCQLADAVTFRASSLVSSCGQSLST